MSSDFREWWEEDWGRREQQGGASSETGMGHSVPSWSRRKRKAKVFGDLCLLDVAEDSQRKIGGGISSNGMS